MNTRYRITRNADGNHPEQNISIDEYKSYFGTQPDFEYAQQYSFRSAETTMTIPGDFFLWHVGEATIPFRYFEGDLYVAVSHEIIFQKMLEIVEHFDAQYIEG
ncbi:hypothetical protein [Paenibacillus sp. 481]|uniref:hypothetical protein n=1 Tax=Paenibacillus sp. 481 TaxID=2835869 RepID=UPI001E5EAA49|nr:hypothetical protein [Paenibacillus sp. 481]UHA75160.1 hypothetical protein KIK04_09120 [Paenibacillus sp. 481]